MPYHHLSLASVLLIRTRDFETVQVDRANANPARVGTTQITGYGTTRSLSTQIRWSGQIRGLSAGRFAVHSLALRGLTSEIIRSEKPSEVSQRNTDDVLNTEALLIMAVSRIRNEVPVDGDRALKGRSGAFPGML